MPYTKITLLPCEDSYTRAEHCRAELDIPRETARQLGESAVRIAATIPATAESVRRTIEIFPTFVLPKPPSAQPVDTLTIQVTNETSFNGAKRLIDRGQKPLVLNFASGVQPGGGFLTGSRAQEETLARSSGLYATIKDSPMYAYHKTVSGGTWMASEWAILSPAVPVFRTDSGKALATNWHCDILTCAAPVASKVGLDRATAAMETRIHRVLAIAKAYGYRSLVLGAWGCGAYHNDPYVVSEFFRDALTGKYRGDFEEVVFAIADWSAQRNFLAPFRDTFAELG